MSTFYESSGAEAVLGADARPTPSIPLYLAGILVQTAGLAAVGFQMGESIFFLFTFSLTLLGAGLSYFLRRQQVSPRFLRVGVIAIAMVFLYALRGAGVFGALVPAELQGGTQEMLLVTLLCFCATFAAFLWTSDEAVVFSCVWAIAMIGLTGTINVNRELIYCFVLFLAAAVFLLIHQNALGSSGRRSLAAVGEERAGEARRGVLKAQLIASVLAWVGALVLGFLVAIPVQMVGKNLSLANVIQRLKVSPTQALRNNNRPKLIFDNLQSFPIGLGPVDDDPTERLFVLSDGPHYWRGRTYDQYNGHGWGTTISTAGVDIPPVAVNADKNGWYLFNIRVLGEPRRGTRRVTHNYRLASNDAGGPLYHAAEPRQVRVGATTVIEREDNTIGVGRVFGDQYEITSDVVSPRPRELRAAPTNYSEEIRLPYLLQGTSNDALAVLLREALAGVPNATQYDKAQAIRRFVANRCVYTREARAVPADRDAVDFFLNESKEGYCDLYATAMTVLCRYAGMPARVATGFAPGTLASNDLIADRNLTVAPGDKRKWYVLRGSDLHSWCEVYFVGYGWIPFDATQDTAGAVAAPAATPQPQVRPTGLRALLERGAVPLALVGLGLVGVLYVAVTEVWSRSRLRIGGKGGGRVRYARTDALTALFRKTARQIGRRGPRLTPSITPGEYAEQVRLQLGDATAEALLPLVRAVETASYSLQDLTEAELRDARHAPRNVRTALKQVPRTRSAKTETGAA